MRCRIVAILGVLTFSAALPLLAETINGCVDTSKGTLRIVKTGEPCDAKEFALSWNTQGVAGTDGKNGTNGINGLPGANGVNGTNGINGTDGRDGLNCEAAAPQPPAQVGTVVFNGISGGPFPIFQLSGGATNTFTPGPGGVSGKVDFSNITVVRKVDAASPQLLHFLASGEELIAVTINLTPGTAGPRTVLLRHVHVLAYSYVRLPNSDELFETISFDFATIEINLDGTQTCWDLVRNMPC